MTNTRTILDAIKPRQFHLTLIVIMLFGILVQLFHFHLTIGSDDQRWVLTAQDCGVWENSAGLHPVYYSRLGFSCLIKAWGGLAGGVTLEHSAVLMFILAAATTMMVGYAARTAFGSATGVAAATTYAAHPLVILYGVVTLPDVLAVALLTLALWLFFLYLKRPRLYFLAGAAIVAGLCFGVKGYYILISLPFGIGILLQQLPWAWRLRSLAQLVVFFAGGVCLAILIPWMLGSPFSVTPDVSEYGQRLLDQEQPYASGFGWIARIAVERLDYLRWLFLELGIVSGFLSLLALTWLTFRSLQRPEYAVLLSASVIFVVFLIGTPASLQPLIFVEMQPRYLTVLLPVLAIGAGDALAALLHALEDDSARRSAAGALLLAFASNILVPNDYNDPVLHRARTQEMLGLKDALQVAQSSKITVLLLPNRYRTLVPDSYYAYGVTLAFQDNVSDTLSQKSLHPITENKGMFIPRAHFRWPLVAALRRGEYGIGLEVDTKDRGLMEHAKASGLIPMPVLVPDTVVMRWLALLGLVKREQQLAGWLYLPSRLER